MVKKKAGPRPSGDVEQIKTKGGDAAALGVEYRTVLEPRLESGLLDGLATDLGSVGGVVPNALSARVAKKAATGTERDIAKATADHINAIRELLKHYYSGNASTLKGWAVGTTVNPKVTKSVLGAGGAIIDRAATNPDEARKAGILAADLTELQGQLTALSQADDSQGGSARSSKDATSTRNATLVRIQRATKSIALAGQIEFRSQAATRAKFDALLASGAKKKKAAAPTPTETK